LAEAPKFCYACGSPVGEGALTCPACQQPAYKADIDELARQARALENAGDIPAAAATWGKALELLPRESPQAATIREHRLALGAQSRMSAPPAPGSQVLAVSASGSVATAPAPGESQSGSAPAGTDWKKRFGPLGVLVAFFAKFKTVGLLLLTKGKFLLFGLTKLNTLLSMFASMALYWALYGWKFGVGFVLGIYVHEMGHVWALRHFGLRASAPMFIPGFGAFVSLYDSPANESQDARIGLAGPIWGVAAAIFFQLAGILTGHPLWFALAHTTAYINLFNLIPIWQLDGGRGFRALDRQQRLLAIGLMGVMWYFTGAGLFLILALGAAYRIFWHKDFPAQGDSGAFFQYAALLVTLGALLAGK
jgi:Zn-dependent protease